MLLFCLSSSLVSEGKLDNKTSLPMLSEITNSIHISMFFNKKMGLYCVFTIFFEEADTQIVKYLNPFSPSVLYKGRQLLLPSFYT